MDCFYHAVASEPNLKAKSKLRAKVSEHRSYLGLGNAAVPRRRERNGTRITKLETGKLCTFLGLTMNDEQVKDFCSKNIKN